MVRRRSVNFGAGTKPAASLISAKVLLELWPLIVAVGVLAHHDLGAGSRRGIEEVLQFR